jgi:hypothetical protein
MFIAIHGEAERKPKAVKAASRLGMQPRQFIFQVMAPVWMFAAENNDGSGDVTGLDDDVLKFITFEACGSVDLLIETGWLERDGDKLLIPRWAEHEPYFAKRARDRMKWRESHGTRVNSRELATSSDAEEKRREESRREKAKDSPASDKPKRLEYPADFEQFWSFYPRSAGKGAAFKVWKRMDAESRTRAIDRAEWVQGCYAALDPHGERIQFLKHPATWLNARGWEDADEEVKLQARGR